MSSNKRVLYIGNVLSKHGLSVTTIETLGPQLESLGYKLTYSSDKKQMHWRLLSMMWAVVRNRKQVSKVLIDTYSNNAFWYAYFVALVCRSVKLSYMPILHGGRLPIWIKEHLWASKQLFANSFINISPSHYNMQAFEAEGFKTCFIPNNICIADYPFTERKTCVPKLLYVRSFDQIYNPIMAIKVLAGLLDKYPEVQLCMVGPDKDGSQKTCEELAKKLNVHNALKITGRLSKQEWHSLSQEYSIFINTTNIDNMPVSVIEAMALGLPVVSTNAGGLPFLIADKSDGILVEKNQPQQMVDAIIDIIESDTLAHSMSLNARRKAESFDWEEVKVQWMNILDS